MVGVIQDEDVGGGSAPTLWAVAAVSDAAVAALSASLDELESLSRFDSAAAAAAERAEQALATARELGLVEFELRAQLVQADLVRRRGNVSEAGRVAQDVRRWATEHDSRHQLARSPNQLAAVFQELGDLSAALENAVQAIDLLDDDAVPALRIDHLARLADCLGLQGDLGARERYAEVLQLAEEQGDVDRQLLVLNNRSYVEMLAGEFETALGLATRLQALAGAHGVALSIGRLDTVARALMGLGRLAEAEAVLLPGCSPEVLDASPDGDAGADFLLTLAEIQRRQGRVAQAQETLDECVRRCEANGLTSIRVRARREQAELHAAGGHFEAAFTEHKLYSQEALDLQSAQRDARARALQAMYETTEARRQSRRYRELSLRDPLTGLYNRRYVDEQLPRLLEAIAGRDEAVSVALLDLDHFKRVNDRYGHLAGDKVLRRIGKLFSSSLRPSDIVSRWGGEEFCIVFPETDVAGAATALASLAAKLRTLNVEWGDEVMDGFTFSAALAAHGANGKTLDELVDSADRALYAAKGAGRDRVLVAQGHPG